MRGNSGGAVSLRAEAASGEGLVHAADDRPERGAPPLSGPPLRRLRPKRPRRAQQGPRPRQAPPCSSLRSGDAPPWGRPAARGWPSRGPPDSRRLRGTATRGRPCGLEGCGRGRSPNPPPPLKEAGRPRTSRTVTAPFACSDPSFAPFPVACTESRRTLRCRKNVSSDRVDRFSWARKGIGHKCLAGRAHPVTWTPVPCRGLSCESRRGLPIEDQVTPSVCFICLLMLRFPSHETTPSLPCAAGNSPPSGLSPSPTEGSPSLLNSSLFRAPFFTVDEVSLRISRRRSLPHPTRTGLPSLHDPGSRSILKPETEFP